jgi:ribosomal protein S18 acetylase RimI-like enzyme
MKPRGVIPFVFNMEKLDISPASPARFNWAASLLSANDPWLSLGITFEKILESLNNPEHKVYIAHIREKACGVIIIHPNGLAGSPYIKSIAVDKEYRSSGVGSALIRFAENQYQSKSRYLFLCVSSFNTRARSFYERLGYTFIGELKDYVIDGASEFLMSKRLT